MYTYFGQDIYGRSMQRFRNRDEYTLKSNADTANHEQFKRTKGFRLNAVKSLGFGYLNNYPVIKIVNINGYQCSVETNYSMNIFSGYQNDDTLIDLISPDYYELRDVSDY